MIWAGTLFYQDFCKSPLRLFPLSSQFPPATEGAIVAWVDVVDEGGGLIHSRMRAATN